MNTTPRAGVPFILAVGASALLFSIQPAKADYFTNANSMKTPRVGDTATLLLNGKLLVAGGHNATPTSVVITNGVELFDPTNGTWTTINGMTIARNAHAAALLSNGKVLVSGGLNVLYTGYLASAELYDPTNGTWTATAAMTFQRQQHTATTLLDGTVLVVAGEGTNSNPLSSVELYAPASGTWTATNPIAIARYVHTATLLPNGKVLIAGGFNGSALSSAQVYNPSNGTWNTTTSLSVARFDHTATLLANGLVLVTGGDGSSSDYLTSSELYNPTNQTWTPTGSLNIGRYSHTATLLPNGKVLLVGGIGVSGFLASAELYDPVLGIWTTTAPMSYQRASPTVNLLPNGNALVAGGGSGYSTTLSNVELYVSVPVPVTAIHLTNPTKLLSGAFRFSFTNVPSASFTAWGTTNLALRLSNWTVLESVTQISSGNYRFTDSQAANYPTRFYRVSSP